MLERERRERQETRAAAAADPFVASVLAAFPGAELLEVRQTAAPVVEAAPDDETENEDTP